MNRCRFRTMPREKCHLPTIYDTTGTQLPFVERRSRGYAMPAGWLVQEQHSERLLSARRICLGPAKQWEMSSAEVWVLRPTSSDCFYGSTSNANTAPFLASGTNNSLNQGSLAPAPADCATNPRPAFCQLATVGSNRVAFIDRNPKARLRHAVESQRSRELMPQSHSPDRLRGSHGVHGTTQVDMLMRFSRYPAPGISLAV